MYKLWHIRKGINAVTYAYLNNFSKPLDNFLHQANVVEDRDDAAHEDDDAQLLQVSSFCWKLQKWYTPTLKANTGPISHMFGGFTMKPWNLCEELRGNSLITVYEGCSEISVGEELVDFLGNLSKQPLAERKAQHEVGAQQLHRQTPHNHSRTHLYTHIQPKIR